MNKQILLSTAILFVFIPAVHANPEARRAIITGSGGSGRCSIELSVDHSAEVEISGDTGWLATTGGQPAMWRRFQCNAPLPRNPFDFRLSNINGRGNVRLVQDPRNTGGRLVIRITDPQGGRGNYAFDLLWRGTGGGGGGWQPGPPPGSPGPDPGHGQGPGGFPRARLIRMCQDSVTARLTRDGYSFVTFDRTIADNQPGRHDWITGNASAKRGFQSTWFSFSCAVDFGSGTIRHVDVRPSRR